MRVLGPRALVQRVDPPKPKSSLIEVVELEPEPSQFGVILEVGAIPDLKKGDAVIVKKFSGSPIRHTLNGEEVEVFMMMEDDILAKVD